MHLSCVKCTNLMLFDAGYLAITKSDLIARLMLGILKMTKSATNSSLQVTAVTF